MPTRSVTAAPPRSLPHVSNQLARSSYPPGQVFRNSLPFLSQQLKLCIEISLGPSLMLRGGQLGFISFQFLSMPPNGYPLHFPDPVSSNCFSPRFSRTIFTPVAFFCYSMCFLTSDTKMRDLLFNPVVCFSIYTFRHDRPPFPLTS